MALAYARANQVDNAFGSLDDALAVDGDQGLLLGDGESVGPANPSSSRGAGPSSLTLLAAICEHLFA